MPFLTFCWSYQPDPIQTFFFLKEFIYLTDSERGNTSRESERGRSRLSAEQGAQCGAQSPRTLGSRPELKADT